MVLSGFELIDRTHTTLIVVGLFGLTLLLTGLFYSLSRRFALLPSIRDRDVHTVRKSRLGGLAMWIAAMVAFVVLAISSPNLLDFHRHHTGGVDISLWGIIAGMLVILVTGLLDDIKGLSAAPQALGQALAGLCLVAAGVGVPYIRLPGSHLLSFGAIASALFTVLWIMAMMNVLNFFDGLDGLASSVSLTAASVLLVVSLRTGFVATGVLSLIIIGITAGFLPWNWYPSKLFMGTVGSQMLGFLLGTIAIISGGKVATAMLVLGVPFFDAAIVIIRRLLARESPFKADLRHLHHRLLRIGLPTPWVVLVINLISVTFGVLALRTQRANDKALLSLVLGGCIGLFIIMTYVLESRAKAKKV